MFLLSLSRCNKLRWLNPASVSLATRISSLYFRLKILFGLGNVLIMVQPQHHFLTFNEDLCSVATFKLNFDIESPRKQNIYKLVYLITWQIRWECADIPNFYILNFGTLVKNLRLILVDTPGVWWMASSDLNLESWRNNFHIWQPLWPKMHFTRAGLLIF